MIMESWSYVCEEKRPECDVIDSATYSLFISTHSSFDWESRNLSSCNESTQLNKITNNLEHKFPNKHNFGDFPSSNTFLGEDKSTSKLSGSVMASDSKEFPLSDLKLGTLVDLREDYSSRLSNEIVQLTEYEAPQKKARASKLNLQIAFCQVHGCNKDLSSSKDYHKKHKVCESHTKAEKVIVNGIEQRFCQQCSRFHLVAEFDDAKRSCRRRLVGHNERRRKPQTGRPRYLQSNNGNMYPRTTSTETSLSFKDYGLLHSQKSYETSHLFKDNLSFTSSTTPPTINGHLYLKPGSTSYDIGARNGAYPFDIGGLYARPWSSLLHDSSASEVFDAESTVHDRPKTSNSGFAHSLLSSSRPHNSSYHFSGPYSLDRKASAVAEQCQETSPILASNFQINQGILCRPEFENVKDYFS